MHPLLQDHLGDAIERAVSSDLGRSWRRERFTDLNERASHPCGIWHGDGFDVFVKFTDESHRQEQFDLECRGLQYLADHGARTPRLVGTGVVSIGGAWLLLLERLAEKAPSERTRPDWEAIGRALATIHQVPGEQFGLVGLDGYFGPLRQDNRPVESNRWADFFRERRIAPFLGAAVRFGDLPDQLVAQVNAISDNLDNLIGDEPQPMLLHGDAQQNNYLSTEAGAVFVDTCPFYGHPEYDLAFIDIFAPVPATLFDAYNELNPIAPEFEHRRELWRIPIYLAIIAVDGRGTFGRTFIPRLEQALRR
jgi:protein-ribulosamine 3-kinase